MEGEDQPYMVQGMPTKGWAGGKGAAKRARAPTSANQQPADGRLGKGNHRHEVRVSVSVE